MKLACGSDEERTELGRRPDADADADQPAEATGGDFWVLCRRPSWAGGEVGLLLPLPGLPLGRYPLMVELELLAPEPEAPKLTRRTKGVVGAVLERPSSSSMALSSMDEFVEMLPRRMKVAGVVGEVPDRPMVVTERRRPLRGSAAPLLGPENEPFPLEGPRWKRLDNAAWVMEPRRWATPGPLVLSDMMCGREIGVGE